MAQKDLIPMSERTKEEVKQIASRGGINSGKARRKKKAMREAAQMVLGLKSPEAVKKKLKELGVKSEDTINQTAMLIAVLNRAMRGDVRAAEFMRDTAGENPQVASPQAEMEDDPLTKSIYETAGDPDDVPEAERDIQLPEK